MTRQKFTKYLKIIYGQHFYIPAAKDLGVHKDTVRGLAKGHGRHKMPENIDKFIISRLRNKLKITQKSLEELVD